jgi:hypothetical protein
VFLDLARPEIELTRQFLDEVLADGRVRRRADERCQFETGSTSRSGVRRKISEKKLEERRRVFEELTEGLLSSLSDDVVGIHSGRQHHHRDLDARFE